jgi:acyl carrier protein
MCEDTVRQRVRGIVSSILPRAEAINDDSPLEASGLDSVAMVQLLAAIEDRFEVSIPPEEITPENFGSIATVVDLLRRLPSP